MTGSTQTAAVNESTDDLAELREELSELRTEVEDLREENRELRARLEDHERRLDAHGTGLEAANDDLANLDDRVDELGECEPTPDVEPQWRAESLLELYLAYSDRDAFLRLDTSSACARFVATKIKTWGTGTPSGFRITSSEVRGILLDGFGVGHTEQVSRVMDTLVDLAGEGQIVDRVKDGTRRLIVADEYVNRLVEAMNRTIEPDGPRSITSVVMAEG